MPRLTRDRGLTLGFVAVSFALAFWQTPGWATTDTKIDLHVDPVRFLSDVASVWTPTTDLGEVHSAQYTGYLWPMGPFYASLHSIGLAPWVVQRLWLGLMFALAAWGMLKLLDILIGRPRGIVHLVATTFFILNPYTVVFTARTSITLLGYAALPWLLIVVHRGVRAVHGWRGWRGWWWAAALALILTSIGAGINAAVVGWMLVGPLVLLLYEPATGAVRWRDALGFLARMGVLGVFASLWWIVPLLVHVQYGIDFLQFTEQPRSIWGTNSVTESLRLMGYWTSYIGTGFEVTRPLFSDSATMLFNPLVVGASLLLPALASAGFVSTRRWRYGPFLLLLAVVGVLIMMAGFPDGTPLRSAMEWVYRHVFVLRFMRTTQKAAPLVALGIAGLLGLAAQQAWARLRALDRGRLPRAALVAAPAALAALIVLGALPLIRGRAIDSQLRWKRIPAAWTNAGSGLNRELPANSRALVLPGSIFAFYKWGGTVDAILPRLTSRPVAVRYETPYSDLHAVDLLTTVDSLVQQRRLVPGQLAPLLRLMGVRAVVSGSDDDITRSGALDPAAAAAELNGQGLGPPARSYGPVSSFPPASGDIAGGVDLPQVRRYDVAASRGIVHVDPLGPATIVDGGAGGLADMAAFGVLPDRSAILYAGDLSTSALSQQAARGADVLVSDSNRRRPFLPEFSQQNLGAALVASDPLDKNSALVNPFSLHGTDTQTVSVLQGARYLRAPGESGSLQFPEHAPIAAFDGDPSTSWIADGLAQPSSWWIEIGLDRPRDVPYVDVYPLSGGHGVVTAVDVNGVRSSVGLGWTRIPVHLHHVSAIRVRIDHVVQPKVGLGGAGGFREIRIPGVHVRQFMRAPIVAGRALAGHDLRHNGLTYLFERTTGDNPFLRDRFTADPVLGNVEDRGDAERYVDRVIFAPAPRSYVPAAWVSPAVDARDSALDRLVGAPGGMAFDSSSRFHDQPRYRASSAFDGRSDTAWIGVWVGPDAPPPWISWSTPRSLTVSRLRLAPAQVPVRRPTLVQVSWSRGATPPLPVAPDGSVVLPHPVRARGFRLTILAAQFPSAATASQRAARAVGIASLSVPGLKPVAVPRRGPLATACGSVRAQAGGRVASLRAVGTIEQLDAGQPLPARACAGAVPIGAGIQEIRSLPGPFSVDLLELRSAPLASGASTAAAGGGRVIDPGHLGRSSVSGVRVALDGPSWLVLGESFDRGWRATCDGRSLGAPQVVDGYANGWLAPAGCHAVTFSFAPQGRVRLSYLVSAVSCLLLAAFLLGGRLLGRDRHERLPEREPAPLLREPAPHRMPLPRALAIALVVTVPLSLFFALRAGVVIGPALTFILWRGVAPGVLAGVAAALLGVVVPVIYLVGPLHNQGGYDFGYSTQLIGAHWVGVAAVLLLAMASWRTLAAAQGRTRGPRHPPTSELPAEGRSGPPGHDLELAGAARSPLPPS